jgi:hypothetical protein
MKVLNQGNWKKKSIMVALSDFSEDNMGYFGLYA